MKSYVIRERSKEGDSMKGFIAWIFIIAALFLLLLAIKPDLPTGMKEGWNSMIEQIWFPFMSTNTTIPISTSNTTKAILLVTPYP